MLNICAIETPYIDWITLVRNEPKVNANAKSVTPRMLANVASAMIRNVVMPPPLFITPTPVDGNLSLTVISHVLLPTALYILQTVAIIPGHNDCVALIWRSA